MGDNHGLAGFVLSHVGEDATAYVRTEPLLSTFEDDNPYPSLCPQLLFYCIVEYSLGVVQNEWYELTLLGLDLQGVLRIDREVLPQYLPGL